MSCFLSTFFPFPPVYHSLSLTLLHVATLPKLHPSYTNMSCQHPLLRPKQLPLPLSRQAFPLPLLPRPPRQPNLPPSPVAAASSTATNSPASVSSAAPDAYTPSPPPPPPARVVSILPPTNDHTMRTHAKSGFCLPTQCLNLLATPSLSISPIPKTYKTALLDTNWAAAMRDEFSALLQNETWQLVPCPPGANVVSGKWVFRQKFHSDGSILKIVRHYTSLHRESPYDHARIAVPVQIC
jgi:hypothetical protein